MRVTCRRILLGTHHQTNDLAEDYIWTTLWQVAAEAGQRALVEAEDAREEAEQKAMEAEEKAMEAEEKASEAEQRAQEAEHARCTAEQRAKEVRGSVGRGE